MNWQDARKLSAQQLVELLDVDREQPWFGEDFATILRHQLNAPLLPDLFLVPGVNRPEMEAIVARRSLSETFLQHLTSSNPVTDILIAIKSFAREIQNDPGNPLQNRGAKIIYFAAIAAAFAKSGPHITSLSVEEMQEGFQWTISQPIPKPLHISILDAMTRLQIQLGKRGCTN